MKGSMVTSDGKCTIILIINAYYCSLEKVKGVYPTRKYMFEVKKKKTLG